MAKDKEKKIAYTLYVDQCMTAKEIADKLDITEKTVGAWIKKGNWKDIQLSKQTTTDNLLIKYNELLGTLLDKRLEFEKNPEKIDEDWAQHKGVVDEMSKVSAMIDKIQKDGRPSLRIHILCLERFMGSLNQHNPKLFLELIDYQILYLQQLAEELK